MEAENAIIENYLLETQGMDPAEFPWTKEAEELKHLEMEEEKAQMQNALAAWLSQP